jgi:hypothetical protein
MTFDINFSKNENLQGGDNIAIFVYIYRCPKKKDQSIAPLFIGGFELSIHQIKRF